MLVEFGFNNQSYVAIRAFFERKIDNLLNVTCLAFVTSWTMHFTLVDVTSLSAKTI